MRPLITFAAIVLALGGLVAHYADRIPGVRPEPAVLAAVQEPAPVRVSSGRTVVVPRDSRGHFQVDGRVEGRRMEFIVDTGASSVALTASDAARLGLRPTPRDFTAEVRTANGTVRAAPQRLARIEIGGIIVRDVQAIVLPDEALGENLLGLSFLSRLRRFEYANGRLVLEQ
jgi:aspartyl protease family protein